jgi:alpha-aminoadipate carrier protein LysW
LEIFAKRGLQNPAGAVRLSAFQVQTGWRFSPQSKRVRRCRQPRTLEEDNVPTGTCPECDAEVHVDTDADKGDIVSCEECGTDLEIVGLDPVELDVVEEEDLEDDDDEEDDF